MLESFRIDWDGIQRQEEGKEKIKMEEYPDDPSDLLLWMNLNAAEKRRFYACTLFRSFFRRNWTISSS